MLTTTKTLFYCVIGTTLEWYDFAVFGMLSPILSKTFFPHQNKTTAFIIMAALFATGFIMRPIGGIILGHIGDKYGRKKAIILSLILMTIATTGIGLLPAHQDALFVVLFLLFLRLLQGVSVGGEFPGIITFAGEISPPKKFFFYQSIVQSGANNGVLLGTIVSLIFLSIPNINAWRIPFLASIILGVVSFYFRMKIMESTIFQEIKKKEKVTLPIITVITQFYKRIIWTSLLMTSSVINFYYIFIYYPSYLSQLGYKQTSGLLGMNTISILISAISIPLFGLLIKKSNFYRITVISLLVFIIAPIPTLLLASYHPSLSSSIQILYVLLHVIGAILPPSIVFLVFPVNIRYTAIALAYSLSAILGGTFPLISTALVKWTDANYVPGIYVASASLIALIILHINRHTITDKMNKML